MVSQANDAHAVDERFESATQDCLLELVHSSSIRAPLTRLCDTCRAILGADTCEMYLSGVGGAEPVLMAAGGPANKRPGPLDTRHWKALARLTTGYEAAAESPRALLFPLRHERLLVAALRITWPAATSIPGPELERFTRMVPLMARIMISVQLAQQQRRHDLYEERAAISRELHDSLAQSLAYLKIQASRLDQSLQNTSEPDPVGSPPEDILGDLRETLRDAYRQLRELMTTFRLTMHGKSFRHAVRDSVDEFTIRSNIGFELDNAWRDDVLSVEEEMQVLQIIREALYNIVRHSQADHARISLTHHGNVHRLNIQDNGIGMNAGHRKLRNLGLVIMQERARRLDGAMRIAAPDEGGTQIEITFTPRAMVP